MFNIFYLFEDCLEMLMEKASCKTPQEEKSFPFPFTSAAVNDNLTNNSDRQSSSLTSLDVNNKIPKEHHKG